MNNNMGNSPINSRGCLNSRCGNTRNMNCNMNTMHNGTGCGMNRSFNAGNRCLRPTVILIIPHMNVDVKGMKVATAAMNL